MTSYLQVLNAIFHLTTSLSSESLITYQVPLTPTEKLELGYSEDGLLDFVELTQKYGYVTKSHAVTTEDGYILSLFHMNNKNCSQYIRPPVLLHHGVLESADLFLDMGPKRGLAYILADACFDLWVGNARGTYYGRAHTTLDPDKDAEFWQFSSDEYGYYDVPAQIDYIIRNTGEHRINFVGYSQGGGSILSLASEKTEYNDKVSLFIGISPATRLLYLKSKGFKLLVYTVYALKDFLSTIGIQELLFKGSIVQSFLEYSCQAKKDSILYQVCENFIYTLDGYHPGAIMHETYKILHSHFPAGVSVRVLSRYAQTLTSNEFKKYDFGTYLENMAHYGSYTAPVYNLSNFIIPTVLIYGLNDILITPEDIRWLANQLPYVLELKEVDDHLWNHVDNVYNYNATNLVYPMVLDYLKSFSH